MSVHLKHVEESPHAFFAHQKSTALEIGRYFFAYSVISS